MNHRKPRPKSSFRAAVGIGIAATAGLAVAAGTSSAGASPLSSRIHRNVAVDMALSRADRAHRSDFDESFRIHEFGPSVAVTANNRATAVSAGCSVDSPCRSVALSYQIVTTAGRNARLINASNTSRGVNDHCPACETFSGAYQFIVATPRGFSLSRAARDRLDSLSRQVDALEASRLPIARITQEADDLARQVKAILDSEAARAPRAAAGDASADFAPHVTMHRYVR